MTNNYRLKTPHMPHPSHTLAALGFTESEIKTYFVLIKHGSLTASDLAKQSELSRQTVYESIEALSLRALVTTAEHDGKRFFRAEHPEKLLSYAKRREQEMCQHVNDLAQEMTALEMQMHGERPVVKTYQGKEGVRAIMEEAVPLFPETIYEITDVDAMLRVLTPEDIKPMRQTAGRRVKKLFGIVGTRDIASTHAEWRSRPPNPSITKHRVYIPQEEADFNSHVEIIGDTVTFVTYTGRMDSVVITHPSIAKIMRLLFKYAFRALYDKQSKIMNG